MDFNPHYQQQGKHAVLSASVSNWLRYSDDKFVTTIQNRMQAAIGTELHDLAAKMIRLGVKLEKTQKTLNMYVNDAIGFRMQPEQVLYYSDFAFGTADAISFRKETGSRRRLLRIHDLKTGKGKTSMDQLYVYAAFFCLEYGVKPSTIDMEFRIYQNDFVQVQEPDHKDILVVMDKIVHFDKLYAIIREEVSL